MTKKIIVPGSNRFESRCYNCGCVFEYQREDIVNNIVNSTKRVHCPSCCTDLPHLGVLSSDHMWSTRTRNL